MAASITKASKIPPSIYFGGCCFGGAFYVGVHEAMVKKWGKDFHEHIVISGGSAGTIFAVGLALGKSPEFMAKLYKDVAEQAKIYGPIYYASVYMTKGLEEMLADDPLAYKKLEGKCCFGTTSFFSKHRWHLSWESNEDLLDCIQGSYHIPFYCQRIKTLKGIEVVDGAYGFAGIDLPHGDETLYVGIDPHAEITRIFTYKEMFFPALGEDYLEMVKTGYNSMMQWDGKFKMKVGHRRPNYEALYVLWLLKVLEILIFEGFVFTKFVLFFIIALLKSPFIGV
mmetsp:Transcript_1085/g.1215  ORF Transcript_1085/g.1215 Transcript_1085/m.1215 type:complete len:282 (+) Transcript_1085:112-957(+)